jgi:hypothetical protein
MSQNKEDFSIPLLPTWILHYVPDDALVYTDKDYDRRANALELAAQCWCDPETEKLVMIPELAEAFAKRLVKRDVLLDMAWVIIANASGGNWKLETEDWTKAAEAWCDKYHEMR